MNYHLAKDAGVDKPTWKYKLARKLVLKKAHEALGMGRLFYFVLKSIDNRKFQYIL